MRLARARQARHSASQEYFYRLVEGILMLTFVYVLGLVADIWRQLAALF